VSGCVGRSHRLSPSSTCVATSKSPATRSNGSVSPVLLPVAGCRPVCFFIALVPRTRARRRAPSHDPSPPSPNPRAKPESNYQSSVSAGGARATHRFKTVLGLCRWRPPARTLATRHQNPVGPVAQPPPSPPARTSPAETALAVQLCETISPCARLLLPLLFSRDRFERRPPKLAPHDRSTLIKPRGRAEDTSPLKFAISCCNVPSPKHTPPGEQWVGLG